MPKLSSYFNFVENFLSLYLWIISLLSCTKTSNSWSKTNNSYSCDSIGNASSIFFLFVTSKLVVITYIPSIGKNISNPSSLYVHGKMYIFQSFEFPKYACNLTRAPHYHKSTLVEKHCILWYENFHFWHGIKIVLHLSHPKYFSGSIRILWIFFLIF